MLRATARKLLRCCTPLVDAAQKRLVDGRCSKILGRQFGVITRAQALDAGLTPRQIQRLLGNGTWRRLLPTTYALAAAEPSLWHRAAAAACWAGSGGAVSHETACALRRMANARRSPIEISSTKNRRAPEVVVHLVGPWGRGDIVFQNGIPVTSIERTLVDMAARELAPRMEELIDEALRRSLTTAGRLDLYVRANCGSGRRGPAALRALLPRYQEGGKVAESILETRIRQLLEHAPLPKPVQQYEVHRDGRFVARVDFAWPIAKVAVEAVGRAYHEGRWERDLARANSLTKLGWVVIYVTWEDVHLRPRETVMAIAQALGIPL